MKSILVDALRGTQDDDGDKPEVGRVTSDPDPPAVGPTGDELALVDSEQEDTAADAEFAEFAVPANDAAQEDTQSIAIDDEAPPAAPSVRRRQPVPFTRRFGLWLAPACIVIAASTALSHLALNAMRGANAGNDLADLGAQYDPTLRGRALDAEEVAETRAFALQRGKVPVRAPAPVPAKQTSANAAPGPPPAETPITPPPDIVIARATARPEDPAHGLVQAGFDAFRDDRLGDAERAYRDALALAPRHPRALEGLAAVLQRSGRSDEALDVFDRLLEVEPDNTLAAAALLAATGNDAAAAVDLKLMIQRHPEAAQLHFALGSVYAGADAWVDAQASFARASALDAANPNILFNLAVSQEHLGRRASAAASYRAALLAAEHYPGFDARIIIERLATLAEYQARSRAERQE